MVQAVEGFLVPLVVDNPVDLIGSATLVLVEGKPMHPTENEFVFRAVEILLIQAGALVIWEGVV